jgi:signal transduction histidine kinase
VSCHDILHEVVTEGSHIAHVKGLEFNIDIQNPDALVKANKAWLHGAVQNLIVNACKFTSKGHIDVVAKIVESNLQIQVSDTGIGVESSELPKLFTKFHRATDTLQYEYEGEGLGLYLTKLIIEELHGRISAESTLGVGSVFTVWLPLADQKGSEVAHQVA